MPKIPALEEARSETTSLAFGAERSPTPRFYVSPTLGPTPSDPERADNRRSGVRRSWKSAAPRSSATKPTPTFGDSIAKFMRAIGERDPYLRGAELTSTSSRRSACIELFEIWRNSRQDEGGIPAPRSHLHAGRRRRSGSQLDRVRYAKYWKDRARRTESRRSTTPAWTSLGVEDFRDYKLTQDFATKVGDILALFA